MNIYYGKTIFTTVNEYLLREMNIHYGKRIFNTVNESLFTKVNKYRISANSFRGNYPFLNF